jgi:uncharacterized membrane protein YqgA involved in biofilm formation
MLGTLLNVAGILAGGIYGLVRRRPLSPVNESFFKVTLGAFLVFYGLRLTWVSFEGTVRQVLLQLLLTILSLMIGKLIGKLLRLQDFSNRLGRTARERLTLASSGGAKPDFNAGFLTCAGLFCAAPLAWLGALQEGLSGYFYPLAVKAVIDGLAVLGFIPIFGWSVIVSALPVLALQGTLTLATAGFLRPFLEEHGLLNSVNSTGGLLVFCVALVILNLKKVEIANYLPSLAIAPLLTWAASRV